MPSSTRLFRLSLRFPGLCVRMGCEYLLEGLFVFVSRRVKSLISDLYKSFRVVLVVKVPWITP